jgi:mono/diheme cytochrome c family protein
MHAREIGKRGKLAQVMLMPNTKRSILAAAFMLLFAKPAGAEGGDVTLGQRLAQEWCAKCHAIGPVGASPFQVAPPFRELHLRYNVEDLAESLGEGILVGHPSMPVFRFDPDQIANLIAYLKTLEKR